MCALKNATITWYFKIKSILTNKNNGLIQPFDSKPIIGKNNNPR